MGDAYAQMLANPNLSEEQRANILKMQARRRQRDQQAAAAGSGSSTTAAASHTVRPHQTPSGDCRVLLSFLQPCWLTPWNLVTKMLSKQLQEPLELRVRRDATVGELQGMIETATGMRGARQRLYVARPAAARRESDNSGMDTNTATAASMRLLRTDDSAIQIAALCSFWPAVADAQETDNERPFVVVWLAAVPGCSQPSAALEEAGTQQAQQQTELEEHVRCQLIASGGLQLSYDTDLFTRPMHRTGAPPPPQPEPAGQVEPQ
jgi:hypothetical protein